MQLIPIYSTKSQSFAPKTEDIAGRFCTCDECGRHVHNQDRNLTVSQGEPGHANWFCSSECRDGFNGQF